MVDSVFERGGVARGDITRAPKEALLSATSTKEASCTPTSTPSSPHFMCGSTISCHRAGAPGIRPGSPTRSSLPWLSRRCSSPSPTTASSWRSPAGAWGTCSPYLPKQPGYNKRLRALAPTIARIITHLAAGSPSFCDNLRLLDSTPVPCGQSRETARRSELAGHAAYGWGKSHSRYFWGFRLYVLCAADGMPICFELAAANIAERVVATEMLDRVDLAGYTVMADKGFAGADFEQHMAALGARFLRPDRKDEPRRHGSLGPVRQWIESVFWTCKGQLTLEAHGGRTI